MPRVNPEQWRAFPVAISAHENAVLAQLNPDTTQASLIVVTEAKRVLWYDVSRGRIPIRPLNVVGAPPPALYSGAENSATDAEDRATCAVLFDAPKPAVALNGGPPASPPRRVATYSPASATEPIGGVHFDDPARRAPGSPTTTAAPSAAPQTPLAQSARLQNCLIGATGTRTGRVELFAWKGYTMGYQLRQRNPIVSIVVVEPLGYVAHSDTAADDVGDSVSVAEGASTVAASVELSSNVDGFGSAPTRGHSWSFTLAALDAEGNVSVLMPRSQVVRNVQRTIVSRFGWSKIASLAASADGVVYHGGSGSSRRVMCLAPDDGSDAEPSLKLPTPSLRTIACMDAHRHMVVCSRGKTAYVVDFRSHTSYELCDATDTITAIRVSPPCVFLGCDDGGIACYNYESRALLGEVFATNNGAAVRRLDYSWTRGVLVVTDDSGGVEMAEPPLDVRRQCRGPPAALATARVLQSAVKLEQSVPRNAASAAAALVLERFLVPENVAEYMGKQARLV